MKGKIITIEGLDGAGKSTQIKLLTEKLDQRGIPHKFIHFPMLNQGVYGKLVVEFLRGEFGALEEVHPKLVALLFAEDRKEHVAKINQWLDEGHLVVLDRYVKSNVAFQCAKMPSPEGKRELREWILKFEFQHNALPKPIASFFLNVPIAHIQASLEKQRQGEDRDYLDGKTDIHEASMDFQRAVLKEYMGMLEDFPDFYEIPCFSDKGNWLDPQLIHQRIMGKLEGVTADLIKGI